MNKELEAQYFLEDYIVDNLPKSLGEILETRDEALVEEHLGAILLEVQSKILQDTSVLENFDISIPRILCDDEEDKRNINPLLVLIEDCLITAVKVGFLLNSGSMRQTLKQSSLRTAIRDPEKESLDFLSKIKKKLTKKKKVKKGRRAEDDSR